MRKLWLPVLAGLFLVVVIATLGFLNFLKSTYSGIVVTPTAETTPDPKTPPSPTPDPKAPYIVLILGYGGGTHAGGYLTDTMIAMKVFPKENRATLVSIPRDLWVELPVSETEKRPFKINHAYAIGLDDKKYPAKPARYTGRAGGGELAKYAVSQILGEPVDNFVAMSFFGFEKSIDVLGGIDVLVERAFDDYYYPLAGRETDPCGKTEEEIAATAATLSGELLEREFPCRYEQLSFVRGPSHMDGATALKYVRSRHSASDGSDFARARRQQQVIAATRDKILSIGFLPKLFPFISTLTYDLTTDITLDKFTRIFLPEAGVAQKYTLKTVTLTTDNVLMESYSFDRQYILIPKSGIFNWLAIREFLKPDLSPVPEASAAGVY